VAGLEHLDIRQDWGEQMPFADGSFDIVYARAVLHHARDLSQLCREMGRVLRPGGRLLAVREHVIDRAEDLAAFLASHPLQALYGGEHAYRVRDYRAALEAGGCRVRRTLGPLDSPINYAPLRVRDVHDALVRRLACYLGPTCGVWVASIPGLLPCCGWVRSRWDRTPGRLFAFYAIKV
jgi:SAM-dependent methyltransferase